MNDLGKLSPAWEFYELESGVEAKDGGGAAFGLKDRRIPHLTFAF